MTPVGPKPPVRARVPPTTIGSPDGPPAVVLGASVVPGAPVVLGPVVPGASVVDPSLSSVAQAVITNNNTAINDTTGAFLLIFSSSSVTVGLGDGGVVT
jgi:hypothetical protein